MTLKKLLETLNYIVKKHPEKLDNTVVIKTGKPGVPTAYMSNVKMAYFGGDWEKGLFIFCPEDSLVPIKKLEKSVREVAEDRLRQIEEQFKKLGQDYQIKKSQKATWIEGFCQGVRMQIIEGKE